MPIRNTGLSVLANRSLYAELLFLSIQEVSELSQVIGFDNLYSQSSSSIISLNINQMSVSDCR